MQRRALAEAKAADRRNERALLLAAVLQVVPRRRVGAPRRVARGLRGRGSGRVAAGGVGAAAGGVGAAMSGLWEPEGCASPGSCSGPKEPRAARRRSNAGQSAARGLSCRSQTGAATGRRVDSLSCAVTHVTPLPSGRASPARGAPLTMASASSPRPLDGACPIRLQLACCRAVAASGAVTRAPSVWSAAPLTTVYQWRFILRAFPCVLWGAGFVGVVWVERT